MKWLVAALLLLGGATIASNRPAHYTDKGFKNVYPHFKPKLWDFVKWRFEQVQKDLKGPEDYQFKPASTDLQYLKNNRNDNTVTWIGHATVLVQMGGVNILTDPQFSHRASPVQWAGPERVIAPAVAMADLPPIHAVVISHDHYDSLDVQSIKDLKSRPSGDSTLFLVPLGLKQWFNDLDISNVIELDWWQQHNFKDLQFIATPVQHWSKRLVFSENTTLWASWVIKSKTFNFYFGGDTGYAPHFKETGARLGPFDLAALPIGAYEPRWFMKGHHINPEEAVQIHQDLGAKQSFAIHWGTFILTDEPLTEPPEKLKTALAAKNIDPENFWVLQHGESRTLGP